MTQFANGSEVFLSSSTAHQQSTHIPYYVTEPTTKRPFPDSFENMENGPPRAKRRFEKVSACFENFSISREPQEPVNLESSSDEEMYDEEASTSAPQVIIEEPEEAVEPPKRIKLDEKIQQYLMMARQNTQFLPKLQKLKGDELTVWQPVRTVDPFEDGSMRGRINEIDDEEELADEFGDVDVAFPDDLSSSTPSPPSCLSPNIVEVPDSQTPSPQSLYMDEDDDQMDMD